MILRDAVTLLTQMDFMTRLEMFWYLIAFELPRYTLAFLAVAVTRSGGSQPARVNTRQWRISVVIAGHNEAESLQKCIRSLGEQTRQPDEIIVVDDGSTDGTREVIHQLIREGKIHAGLCNQVRCGKAAACNLGMSAATGDIIVNLDADCSYDYDAIEMLVQPFGDPRVGATCGNIGVRNSTESCITSWQAVEYLISISLGKRVLDFLDLVVCASGAFGAFRSSAIRQIGINEPGPGEDFDMTMRLRRAGWTVRFVGEAWCMTDVAATAGAICRQRRRWDRDTIRIRMRKFKDVFNSVKRHWNGQEVIEQIDWLLFNLSVTIAFPIYITLMFYWYGSFAWTILLTVSLVYMALDALAFLLAVLVAGRHVAQNTLSLTIFALTFGLYNGYFMRCVRVYAYLEEWLFLKSYQDSYVPRRVLDVAERY